MIKKTNIIFVVLGLAALGAVGYVVLRPDTPKKDFCISTCEELGAKEKPLASVNITEKSSADEYTDLGLKYYREGKPEHALTAYQSGILLASEDSQLYMLSGNVLRDQGKLDEAQSSYKTAIEKDPMNTQAYINLAGMLFSRHNDKKGAIEVINAGLVATPDDARLKILLDSYQQ